MGIYFCRSDYASINLKSSEISTNAFSKDYELYRDEKYRFLQFLKSDLNEYFKIPQESSFKNILVLPRISDQSVHNWLTKVHSRECVFYSIQKLHP